MKIGPFQQLAPSTPALRPAKTVAPVECQDAVELSAAPQLSPVQRRHLTEGTQRAIRTALIIGGGPGGLAAAIKLAERGVKVMVVEARTANYVRPHHLNARQDTLDSFFDYGVGEQVRTSSGLPESDAWRGKHGSRCHGEAVRTLEAESVAQVRISDVEKALYQRTQQLGVLFMENHTAVVHPTGPDDHGMHTVSVQRVDKDLAPVGQAEFLGAPDLIVVADGANSPTRRALGIEFEPRSEARYYLGGLVEKGIGARYDRLILLDGDEKRHLMATGHAVYPQTWVSVEADSSVLEMTPEQRTGLLAQQSSLIMRQDVRPEDISWGAGQITVVQNREAATSTSGNNLVLISDAVRTGSVWVSGGLNLALTADVHNLTKLVEQVNTDDYSREAALRGYDLRAKAASRAWHNLGQHELNGTERPDAHEIGSACLLPQYRTSDGR